LFTFDERHLMTALDKASPPRRTAFATACAARLTRLLLQSEATSPEKETLTNAIELLRADLRDSGETEVDWQALLDHVMTLLPGEDATWHDVKSLLDDSVAAVAYAIRTRLTGSSQEAAWSARKCYEYFDSVANQDFCRRGVEEPTDLMLLEHPETQKELRRQHDLLEVLKRTDMVTASRIIGTTTG